MPAGDARGPSKGSHCPGSMGCFGCPSCFRTSHLKAWAAFDGQQHLVEVHISAPERERLVYSEARVDQNENHRVRSAITHRFRLVIDNPL